MSKYLDAVKRARPEHLYVFDLDRTALDGGTVSDLGFSPVSGVVDEDNGFATLESVDSYIAGMDYNVKFNVLHQTSVNDPTEYYSVLRLTDVALDYFGANGKQHWTMETVIIQGDHKRARYDETSELEDTEGLSVERSGDGWRVVFRVETTTEVVTVAESAEFEPYSVQHVVVVRTADSFAMHVNGVLAGTKTVGALAAVSDDDFYIGGLNSRYHLDTTMALFALMDYSASPADIKSRYSKLSVLPRYQMTAESLDPDISVETELNGSVGTLEPYFRKISDGADSAELHENEDGELSIQIGELGVGVTKSKTLTFDLSDLTAGVSTFLDTVKVVDANSSIVVNYSFDDVDYSTWGDGVDQIPELDAAWGGVV